MSQHVRYGSTEKFVFGWDQPLMTFYLQVHDLTVDEDDESRIKFWAGTSPETRMYEVEDLVAVARKFGCDIPYETQVELYREKDDGV